MDPAGMPVVAYAYNISIKVKMSIGATEISHPTAISFAQRHKLVLTKLNIILNLVLIKISN
jgi:hypothetical protein